MKAPLIITSALAIGLSSMLLAQNVGSGGTSGNTGTPRGISGSSAMPENAQQNPTDEQQDFTRDAASGNAMEVQVGQFVAGRTQNARVKQYAEMLVQDHQSAQQKLKQAAQQAGVALSEDLTPVHRAMLQELEKKSGMDLDRAFIFSAVADHHKDILEYTFAEQNLPAASLKQYAQQCIPTLERHYQGAEELVRGVVGIQDSAAGTGGATGIGGGTGGVNGGAGSGGGMLQR